MQVGDGVAALAASPSCAEDADVAVGRNDVTIFTARPPPQFRRRWSGGFATWFEVHATAQMLLEHRADLACLARTSTQIDINHLDVSQFTMIRFTIHNSRFRSPKNCCRT